MLSANFVPFAPAPRLVRKSCHDVANPVPLKSFGPEQLPELLLRSEQHDGAKKVVFKKMYSKSSQRTLPALYCKESLEF